MDPASLQEAVQNVGVAALVVSFVTGFLFSFNPVALAAIPVSLAYVTKARMPVQAVVFGGMFILGMLLTHVVIGAVAGFGGGGVARWIGRYWGLILGPWLILMGLLWPGWLRLPFRGFSFRAKRVTGTWGAFILGAPFAVAVCPGCTPALVVLIGVAAALGSATWGAMLLLAFAAGRAIPILIGAAAMSWLEKLRPLAKYQHTLDIVGGVMLVLAGLYMLNAYFFVVPALAA